MPNSARKLRDICSAKNYAEGSQVKKGDLLSKSNPQPVFKPRLNKCKPGSRKDQAQLGKTELDVRRYTPLAKQQAISQEELDNAVQANLAAKAQVKADEAAHRECAIKSWFHQKSSPPIDGVAGPRARANRRSSGPIGRRFDHSFHH